MNSWLLLRRDWRGGELGILLLAATLAVTVVVGMSAFVASLQATLTDESKRFLAADRVVVSGVSVSTAWRDRALDDALATTVTLAFPSMAVTAEDDFHLVSVKAVESGYPLRGDLLISDAPYGPISQADRVPSPGEIWLAPRLYALLGVSNGDPLWIGDAKLTVAGVVRREPDATSGTYGYGPRVLMNLADIDATGVVQPGSRVSWRLLLSGSADSLDRFSQWVTPQLEQGQRLLGTDDDQPRLGRTLERAEGFLLIAGSLGVVLAAAAIALSARRFATRHIDPVAIMKSLGATRSRISRLYGGSLMLVGAFGSALGCVLGWLVGYFFLTLFAEELGVTSPTVSIEPFVIGGVTALVCLGFFAWPPLTRLSAIPPLRVLRSDLSLDGGHSSMDYLMGGCAVILLMWWYSGDLRLTFAVVMGLLVVVLAGGGFALLLLSGGRRIGSAAGSVWRFSLAGLQRRRRSSALQMVIFAIAIMLMLLLIMIRGALVEQWQAQLPPGTPNHYVLNIAPEEQAELTAFFDRYQITRQPQFPMTRGRVVTVDDAALAEYGTESEGPRQREANLTYAQHLPEDNVVTDGEWWDAGSQHFEVSLEEEFAERLGATIGSRLGLRIGAEEIEVVVTSIRQVDWQSLKPNFFVILPPAVLAPFPKTYFTSFFLPETDKGRLNDLVKMFPTFTVIELDIIVTEIRQIINRVGQAIEVVLGVILLAGALVLIAGVRASIDARVSESALLRAMGARKQLILGAIALEFSVLGALAGTMAVAGAELAAWGLQTHVLDLSYQPTFWLWPLGVIVGVLLIASLGLWSCRHVVSTPPLVVLREL